VTDRQTAAQFRCVSFFLMVTGRLHGALRETPARRRCCSIRSHRRHGGDAAGALPLGARRRSALRDPQGRKTRGATRGEFVTA